MITRFNARFVEPKAREAREEHRELTEGVYEAGEGSGLAGHVISRIEVPAEDSAPN